MAEPVSYGLPAIADRVRSLAVSDPPYRPRSRDDEHNANRLKIPLRGTGMRYCSTRLVLGLNQTSMLADGLSATNRVRWGS